MAANTAHNTGSPQQVTDQPTKPASIVLVKDRNLRERFVQLPRPVLRAKGLSIKAKAVYALLLDYAWDKDYTFPGQETMAEDLDVSVDTIQRAIKELKEYSLIDYKQTGMNRPNIYYIEPLADNPNLTFLSYEIDPTDEGNRNLRFPETAKTALLETAICGTKDTKSKDTKKERYEEDLNLRNAGAKNSKKEGERGDTTYSHIDRGAIGNGDNGNKRQSKRRSLAERSSIKTQLQQRVDEITQQATRKPPTLPNGYTEEEDAIATYIEDYSRILSDQAHTRSNIRQALNIFAQIKSEIPGLEVEHYLFILETFKDIVKMRANVKNRGAYYFTSLRNHLWPGMQ